MRIVGPPATDDVTPNDHEVLTISPETTAVDTLDPVELDRLESQPRPGATRPATSGAATRIDLRSPSERRAARRAWAVLVLVVVVAGAIRALALPAGLPYPSYIDEGYGVHPAEHMVAGPTWDPGWYRYPSLLSVATGGAMGTYSLAEPEVRRDAEAAEASPYYDVTVPEVLLAGRVLVWLTSVATVLVAALLATRLAGRAAGLVAAILVAVLPALVARSAIVIVDTPATFFVMASMLAASAVPRARRPALAVLSSGACVGFATTSKYPAAAAIIIVLTTIALAPRLRVRAKVGWAIAAVGAAVLAAVVAMPALVLRTSEVLIDIRAQADIYAAKSSQVSYAASITSVEEVGWLVLVLAAVGIVVLLRSPAGRATTIGWLLFVAATSAVTLRSSFQPFRNLLPFTPFLCVAAAAAIVAVSRRVQRRFDGGPVRTQHVALLGGLVVAVVLVLTGVGPQVSRDRAKVDSRENAVNWLAATAEPGERILVAEEIAFAPWELARIPAEVVVARTVGADGFPSTVGFDYVVTGRWKDAADVAPPGAAVRWVWFGHKRVSPAPNSWRGNDQIIDVWQTDRPAPVR